MKTFKDFLLDYSQRFMRPFADIVFGTLLLALVLTGGWLAARHDHYWDWTTSGSNTLTPQSLNILRFLDRPLHVTVFAPQVSSVGKTIGRFLERYQQVLPSMRIDYVDPQLFPEKARDADVSLVGQVLLEYRGRRETLSEISERSISAAIARLMSNRSPWVAVIEGHGERSISGVMPLDFGRFGHELVEQNFLVRPLDLSMVADIPVNTHLVVLSTPNFDLFPGEAERLTQYLDHGGNLLWLMDPGPLNGLDPLVDYFGLKILPGQVVDTSASSAQRDTPIVAVIRDFAKHPMTAGLLDPVLLPGTLAFEDDGTPGWDRTPVLLTNKKSWNETGAIKGNIYRDEVVGEKAGPLPVALALTRPLAEGVREQRVLIMGDGDFMSNAWIESQGNRAFSFAIMRWLSGSERLLELPPPPEQVPALVLSNQRRAMLGIGALVVFPVLFLIGGLTMRWLRWRKG